MSPAFKDLTASLLALSTLLAAATPAPAGESAPAVALKEYSDGFSAFGNGEFVEAIIAWENAFSDARNHHAAKSLMAWLNYATAAADYRIGDYTIASDEVEKAISLHRILRYERSLAGDYIVQARAASSLGDYEKALAALKNAAAAALTVPKSQEACDAFASPPKVFALIALTRAEVETSLGDDTTAKQDLAQAAHQNAGFAAQLASAYLMAASREGTSGEKRNGTLAQAETQATIAITAYSKPQAAEMKFVDSVAACARPGSQRIVPDRFTDALLEDPVWGRTTALAGALVLRGKTELELGENAQAAKDFSEATKQLEHPGLGTPDLDWEAASLESLAEARTAARDPASRPHMLQVLENITYGIAQTPSPTAQWKGDYNLARAYAALGETANAIAAYERAIGIIEMLRGRLSAVNREAFLEDKLRVYDDYVEYLLSLPGGTRLKQSYEERAFNVLQLRLARSTLDLVRKAQLQRFAEGATPTMRADMRIQRQLTEDSNRYAEFQAGGPSKSDDAANLWPQIVALQHESDKLAARLSSGAAAEKRYYRIFHSPPVDIATLRSRVLRPGETMLMYAWLPNSVAVWIITRGSNTVRVIPRESVDGGPDLERIIRHAFIDSIADRDADSFNAWSRLLYRKLFTGVAIPRGTQSLVVIPSGPLYDVAWEALVTGNGQAGCKPGYLICKWPVSYSGSPQLLQVARSLPTVANTRQLLAFAEPVFGGNVKENPAAERGLESVDLQNLPPLPNSLREAELSAQALQTSGIDAVKKGAAASWGTLVTLNRSGSLERYRYILFSTHGALPGNGLEPAIVLSHPERDGWITASKISTLHLNSRAVLLSACWTGAFSASGERPSGDGISALTRAFLYAGAHSVGVTLWPVTDAAAPMLVPRFFSYLHSGASVSKALQQAKKAMIAGSKMNQPYYWAPSVIYGDGY